jgi:hypothetical protein
MQAANKNIDQLCSDKANAYTADKSFATMDFNAIKANLPTAPITINPPKANPTNWFSLNTFLGVAITVATLITVYFVTNKKDKSITTKNNTALNLTNNNIATTETDTPIIVTEIPKDPKTAPKKWIYKMQVNFDKKTNAILPPKQFIDVNDVKTLDNNVEKKEEKEIKEIVLQKFLSQLASPKQVFTISNQEPHQIVCKDGTKLNIKANTFTSVDKKTIEGNVALEIKEAYTYTDMIVNNLHTVSNGNLLESGGMVYINATQNATQLDIDISKPIQVEMPTSNKKDDMQLFNLDKGNWVANGQVQSVHSEKFRRKDITVFNLLESPKWRVNLKGKMIAKFDIPQNCPKSNEEMLNILQKKYGKNYDQVKVRRLMINTKRILFINDNDDGNRWYNNKEIVGDSISLPYWIASKWNLVNTNDSIKYEKENYLDSIIFLINQKEKFDRNVEKEKIFGSYNFSLRNFGWINCDRFYNKKNLIENFSIFEKNYTENEVVSSMLLFPKLNSLLNGLNRNGISLFNNIPNNKNVYFVAFKTTTNKVLTCIQQLTTSKETAKAEDFIELTPTQVKAKLDALGTVR